MASYRLEWRKSTRKDFRGVPPTMVARIVAEAEALMNDPFPPGCVKLAGSERAFRIRVGDYRVIYEVFEDLVLIEVVKVGHRRDVYRS